MKRMLCMLLSVCMLVSLAACHESEGQPQGSESNAVTETQPATGTTAATENQPSAETTAATEIQPPVENPEIPTGDDTGEVKVLSLEKALHTYFEWEDDSDKTLVRSEHSCVTLGQADAEAYPEMAQVLSQIAAMQERAMLDEFYNLVSTAREELGRNRDGFETYVSTLDVQVRRADSLVISLLSDSYSDYGQIDNYRVFHGSNYDTQTGKEIALNEVVDVNNNLAVAVEAELTGHMWTGEFYYEYAVQDYFANTPYHGFSWTLDYTGVTFYFAPGELCDGGAMTATVSFAEYPELFAEKYMAVPAQYTVELPLNTSFFTQLDADGALEEISVSGWYDEERNRYVDYGIYTDTDAQYYCEACFVYDFHPYYVKAAGGNYVYLFCEDFEEGWRQMRLVVLSLNDDGSVTKCGERNVSPSWLADNRFLVPTDPVGFLLDDGHNGVEKEIFTVGSDGLPCL